jgi:hypothetical protein
VNAQVARLRQRVTLIGIACAGGGLILWMLMGWGDPRLPVGLAIAIFIYFANKARKELAESYKGIVVRRIVTALGRGLSYKPTSNLTKAQFESMDLFKERCEKWKSEDEVSGKKNDVKYAIHEVVAERNEHARRQLVGGGLVGALIMSAAPKRAKGVFFSGLIIKLDFNKNFAGHTIVVPDRESQIFGGLLGESETRKKKEIVRLENVDFEGQFSVYSSNDQEARYLMTPKLMELVMEAQALLGAELRLCFAYNSLFVAVPQQKDRFEVNMFGGPVTPETALGDLVEVVNLAERLVDTLDLETRIWTRV